MLKEDFEGKKAWTCYIIYTEIHYFCSQKYWFEGRLSRWKKSCCDLTPDKINNDSLIPMNQSSFSFPAASCLLYLIIEDSNIQEISFYLYSFVFMISSPIPFLLQIFFYSSLMYTLLRLFTQIHNHNFILSNACLLDFLSINS